MLFLQMEDPKKDISIYINSPGGSITAGMAIYDTMNFLTCEVNTYCVGLSASMATVLLAAGTKGKRYALPQLPHHDPPAERRRHRPDVGHLGSPAEEILRWRDTLNHVLAKHSGKTPEDLQRDSDRDFYMTAEQAKAYGLVDHVVAAQAGPRLIPWPATGRESCSFCGKPAANAGKLIAGPGGVGICDACVGTCGRLLERERAATASPRPPRARPAAPPCRRPRRPTRSPRSG
jgi:ATP-dependent Clp protease protease subunit